MITTDFASFDGIDNLNDEPLVDEVFPEEIIELLYDSGKFEDTTVDFGGGVFGVTCRSVLAKCNSDPEELRKILGIRRTNDSKQMCSSIISICKNELAKNAYIV